MNHDAITVRLNITGRVQGVGFRESMRAVAQALDITGWVCNREDGTVEAMVQGLEADVEQLIAWCHSGPPGANVKYVNAELVESAETFIAFSRRTSY
ncbi:MAG: acylphosphatase [Betaproteobacteria bacterium]|nr:acylphosphatase [Betaproteobacteria bacterium]